MLFYRGTIKITKKILLLVSEGTYNLEHVENYQLPQDALVFASWFYTAPARSTWSSSAILTARVTANPSLPKMRYKILENRV
jgi:hypothetical protein